MESKYYFCPMQQKDLISLFRKNESLIRLIEIFDENKIKHIKINGLIGSAQAIALASIFDERGKQQHLVVLPDKEQAAYFYNDLENLFAEQKTEHNQKKESNSEYYIQ